MADKTAYQEALEALDRGEEGAAPSYITAADTLSIANGNQTFLESASQTAEDIPKFIGLAVISGAHQLYNIAPDIGNLFGGEFETIDTGDVVSELDSDLGQFYRRNQESIDLVGFMASSLVPGSAGIKVLNAGQKSALAAIKTGKYGKNMGRALGLLTPRSKALTRKAIMEVADNTSQAGIWSGTALKAVGAGAHQGVLEGIFFETAVAATMFNSPVLENQDFGDFVSNIAFSAGVFGAISGTINAAKLNSALKGAANAGSIAERPVTFIDEAASTSAEFEKVALNYEGVHKVSSVNLEGFRVTSNRAEHLAKARKRTLTTYEQKIKIGHRNLAKGDEDVTSALYNGLKGTGKTNQQQAVIGLQETSKLSVPSKQLRRVEKLKKKADKADGSITAKELDELAEDTTTVSFAKIHGEGAGSVIADSPKVVNLSDTLKKIKDKVEVKVSTTGKTGSVTIPGVKTWKFNTKFNLGAKAGTGEAKAGAFNIFRASSLEAQAYRAFVTKLPKFAPSAKSPLHIDVNDPYLMEKVMRDLGDKQLDNVVFSGMAKGEAITGSLQEFVGNWKVRAAHKMLFTKKGEARVRSGKNQDEIASILDVKSSMLSGDIIRDAANPYHLDDMFATQAHTRAYREKLVSNGIKEEAAELVELYDVPQHIKMVYSLNSASATNPLRGINNFVVENMAIIKGQQRLYQDGLNRASANALGGFYDQLIDVGSDMIKQKANTSGAGYSFIAAASENYGTLASFFEQIGKVTANAISHNKTATREVLEPLLQKLSQNKKAYMEWSTLTNKVRSIEGEYALNAAGDALEPAVLVRWAAAGAKGEAPRLANPLMDTHIALVTPEVRALAAAHIEVNSVRTGKLAGIRTSQGLQFNRSPDVFYAPPVDIKQFPHFATVTDGSITSGNQVSTLYAATSDDLAKMIKKVEQDPKLIVRTKREAEEHFFSEGTFNYEKTLSDNYIDSAIHRTGASAPHYIPTDPKKIIDDTLNWHMQRETGLVREGVSAKYEMQFEELNRLGDTFTNVQTSKFSAASLNKFADSTVNNPFSDYIKTALAVRKNSDYPFWTNMNQLADKAYSKMIGKVYSGVHSAKTPAELAEVNKLLEAGGYRGAAYDTSMEIFANAKPASGSLVTTVRNSNSVMATVVLRLDFMNSMVNAISANVLLGAETKSIIRAIEKSGDKDAMAAIGALSRIAVPGTGETITSAHKMIGKSMSNVQKFIMDEKSAGYKFAKDNGFLTRISDQYRGALNDLAFDGAESIATWDSRIFKTQQKLKHLADKGEQWTGNRLAEEFNRLVAVDVMQQFTKVAKKQGLMTAKEELAYINTFVNRTQGNYNAAQRPGMFQGPIGQAIGLFQTYQFNLMQQLLRHVGEGHSKDAMTLLGLQGTIHGMNGLPAFNAINTHIVGNASGNVNHRDAYDATYGAVGKEAGNWLMYGVGSNFMLHPDLKVNLYTRGDINPRHVTIVPVNPASVPIVQATGKVLGNIFNTASKLAAGGDITTTLLQGLEHNSLSRPLAGLAQVMEGLNNPERASYSTSNKGNVIAANDLLSWANLGRIAGGKPLDTAIALDATYRFKAYAGFDTKKRAVLGQAIKTTMMAGENPTQEQVEEFARKYAESGGRQEQFGQWFSGLYKDANLSQANALKNSLSSPFSQSMQTIMGGEDLQDFSGL